MAEVTLLYMWIHRARVCSGWQDESNWGGICTLYIRPRGFFLGLRGESGHVYRFSLLTFVAHGNEATMTTKRCRVRRTIHFPQQTTSDTDTDAIHGETQKVPQYQTMPEGSTYEYRYAPVQSLTTLCGDPDPDPDRLLWTSRAIHELGNS